MKNISSIIKNNFLILGFTGPPASGCTKAARYFSQKGFQSVTWVQGDCIANPPHMFDNINVTW
jgi:hypothetical protein